ncbi:MAG: cytidine deaminase [Micrococcaceae bacterium]
MSETKVDWNKLRQTAIEAAHNAYAPYSEYQVGVAAITDSGKILSACNVENASYGLTLCAECGLVSLLHSSGGGKLSAFTCVDGTGKLAMPCGRCRQLLLEHAADGMLIETDQGIKTIEDILPNAWGPKTLADAKE